MLPFHFMQCLILVISFTGVNNKVKVYFMTLLKIVKIFPSLFLKIYLVYQVFSESKCESKNRGASNAEQHGYSTYGPRRL